jgi:hypothetical protein
MDIARPKDGFHLVEPSTFAQILASAATKWPRVHDHWDGIKERLKITAHREGAGAARAGARVFEALGDTDSGLPTIRVAYYVLGDTVTFKALAVLDPNDSVI